MGRSLTTYLTSQNNSADAFVTSTKRMTTKDGKFFSESDGKIVDASSETNNMTYNYNRDAQCFSGFNSSKLKKKTEFQLNKQCYLVIN